MQVKWNKENKQGLTKSRLDAMKYAAKETEAQCGDIKKNFQPYMPAKTYTAPREKALLKKMARVLGY